MTPDNAEAAAFASNGPNGFVGMTKRELIATAALAGIIGFPGFLDGEATKQPDTTARIAVLYADALIAELAKPKGEQP